MKNKFPYSKKFIAAALALAVAIPNTAALASIGNATDGKGNIQLTVLDDDNKTIVTSVGYTITDSDGAALKDDLGAPAPIGGTTDASGSFTTPALNPGVYTVTINKGSVTAKTKITVKAGKSATKVNFVYVDNNSVDPSKTGLISDVVYGADGVTPIATPVTVTASNGKTTWVTTTSIAAGEVGKFKLFLPAGKYNLTVDPDPANSTLKNMYYPNLTVTAGQKTSAFNDLLGAKAWANASEGQLGFTLAETITATTPLLSGTVNENTTVSVYEAGTPNKLIASTVAKKDKTTGGGAYSIKLPYSLGGKSVVVEAKDQAGNTYSTTATGTITAGTALTLTKDTTANSVDKAIDITFADTSKLFAPGVTSVEIRKNGTIPYTPLDKTKKEYTVSNGKITIKAGVLTEGSNDIVVKSKGFADSTLLAQDVTAATLNATPAKGTNGGVKFSYAPASGNKLKYKVTNSATVTAPLYKSSDSTLGLTAYTTGEDIYGVDETTNKFVVLYEVNAANEVLKYKVIPLTSKVIKIDTTAPTASVTTATVTIGTDVTTGKSTEAGTTYLVPSGATVTNKASLDAMVTATTPTATKATVTADTAANLVTTGLVAGPYKVYAVDAAGNVSAPSTQVITLQ